MSTPQSVIPVHRSSVEFTPIADLNRCTPLPRLWDFSRLRGQVAGSTWSLVGYTGTQAGRLATQLILAHLLLDPSTFGLVALVNVFLSGLDMLSDLGVGMDVVQHRRGNEPAFLNTAFLIQGARGLFLFGIAAVLAHPFARFYGQGKLSLLATVAAASIALRALASPTVWLWSRQVRLRRLTLLTLASESIGLVVAVLWALASPSAWALVMSRVAGVAAFTIGSHIFSETPLSFRWDSPAARDILLFGTGIFFSTSTHFLAGEAERLVIGKFATVAELGCFALALAISSVPSRALGQVVAQVFFPMLSEGMRADRGQVARDYRQMRMLLLLCSVAITVGFLLLSRQIIAALLGPKYAAAAWMLSILGVRAGLDLFCGTPAFLLFASGTSTYSAAGNIAKLSLLAVGLFIAFQHYGLREALWVLAVAPLPAYFPLLIGLKRRLPNVVRAELLAFGVLLVSTTFSVYLAAFGHHF